MIPDLRPGSWMNGGAVNRKGRIQRRVGLGREGWRVNIVKNMRLWLCDVH